MADTGNLTPLAVVGMAFDFPQDTTSEESFWDLIVRGRTTSTEFPRERMNVNAFYHPDADRPSSFPVRGGHFISGDLGAFDAPFFSITTDEAACMDPQHRKLLETAYHAFEDAGITIDHCSGSNTSVYTGCFTNDYLSILQQDYDAEQRHAAMGIAPSMLANRLSWFFNLKGPSMNIDSACSSSLVALHLACQDLRSGKSSMALVGGTNLVYHPNFMKIMSDFNFLSPDSRCWSFDQRGNGYARGEGIAAIIVKRLDDAVRDGDTIRAVIRNTGCNQDGRTPGITQPSQHAQIHLLRQTFREADLSMEPVRFFEAHGTGTPVGDPIEANAIGAVFRGHRTSDDPLYIGAVKANLGHLEGCSGLAGLIKAILVLERGEIPPIASFSSLNSRINAKELHLRFPQAAVTWPVSDLRRTCVNSFGFGGCNSVAILDDALHYLKIHGLKGHHRTVASPLGAPVALNSLHGAKQPQIQSNEAYKTPKPATNGHSKPYQKVLLTWSAADQHSVQQLSKIYQEYVDFQNHHLDLDSLAQTLSGRRTHFAWRNFAVVDNTADNAVQPAFSKVISRAKSDSGIAFVFTGQGAQYAGMGQQLFNTVPAFRVSLQKSENCLRNVGCDWSLSSIMQQVAKVNIDDPFFSQPLTTCLQIGLVDALQAMCIVPSVVIGHSSGEIAAAYASGALSRMAAVRIAFYRGILSSKLAAESEGQNLGMMAVAMSKSSILEYIHGIGGSEDGSRKVTVGCVNSPRSVTLTGDLSDLAMLEQRLEDNGIFARRLRVSVAYHSSFMQSIAERYAEAIRSIPTDKTGDYAVESYIPLISSVDGDVVTSAQLRQPEYWVRNLTSPVEFEAAYSRLLSAQCGPKPRQRLGKRSYDLRVDHVLEIGPHSALQGPIRECAQEFAADIAISYLPTIIRRQDSHTTFLNCLGSLHCAGHHVDLLRANGMDVSHRLPPPPTASLPRYCFNHQRSYWRESRLSQNMRFRGRPRHELLGTRSLDWNAQAAQWRNVLRLGEVSWLRDHKVGGQVIVPAAAMVVMAVEAMKELVEDDPISRLGAEHTLLGMHLTDVRFSHAISFSSGNEKMETQFVLSSSKSQPLKSQFRLFVLEGDAYIECCSGFIRCVVDVRDRECLVLTPKWLSRSGLSPGEWTEHISKACSVLADADPYRTMASSGTTVEYGPAFQNLHDLRLGESGEAVAHVKADAWKARAVQYSSPLLPHYNVHPSTMDGLAQMIVPALAFQCKNKLATMVPVAVESIWFHIDDTGGSHNGNLTAAAQCSLSSHRGASADVVAFDADSTIAVGPENLEACSVPRMYLQGLQTTYLETQPTDPSTSETEQTARRLCSRLLWKPDISTMSHKQIRQHCIKNRPTEGTDSQSRQEKLILAIMTFIEEALTAIDEDPYYELRADTQYLEAFLQWMRYQKRRLQNGELAEFPVVNASATSMLLRRESAASREQLISEVEETGIDGYFFMHVGRHLVDILYGRVDPLDLMFRNGLADKYYAKMLANTYHAHPAMEYLDIISFKNPALQIIEIGAGTGGQTLRLLEKMSSDGINRWIKYDYTDISPAFFEQARKKFQQYGDSIRFRTCDISSDPIAQSFEAASYDVVIASHVLHATNDIDTSLRNARKLLRPGGKLLLFETTVPDAVQIGFAFGLLRGWWSPLAHEAQKRSLHSPCLSVQGWDERLRATGFSGIDVEVPGQQEPSCQYSSILLSTAIEEGLGCEAGSTSNKKSIDINLVVDNGLDGQIAMAKAVEQRLLAAVRGSTCNIRILSTLAREFQKSGNNAQATVFLVEMDNVLLDGISQDKYEDLKSILVGVDCVLWVTRSQTPEPRHHLSEGLGRVLMAEDSTRKFTKLSLEGAADSDQAEIILRVLLETIHSKSAEEAEGDYRYSDWDKQLHISRIWPSHGMDDKVAQARLSHQKRQLTLRDLDIEADRSIGTKLTLQVSRPGKLETLEWSEADLEDQANSLGDTEVTVQVKAVGLSHRDSLIATGQLDILRAGVGLECAGIVHSTTGSASGASGPVAGDRVCVLALGAASTHIRVPAGAVLAMPKNMRFTEAASIPVALWLSYHAIVNVARLQQGETVLVLQGASSVGQMMISVAKKLGANVLTTVCSAEKGAYLQNSMGVQDSAIFYSYELGSSIQKLQKHLRDYGKQEIDVVVGPLEKDAAYSSFVQHNLASFARIIDTSLRPRGQIGCTAEAAPPYFDDSNAIRASVNMADFLYLKPERAYGILQEAAKLMWGHRVCNTAVKSPGPLHVFDISQTKEAFQHLRDKTEIGKRVLSLELESIVTANLRSRPQFMLPATATYLIAGGLGGLGRSFARWLVHRGARNLILLSRSGAKGHGSEADSLILELQQKGVRVETPAVDISDKNKLQGELNSLISTMPPIRGCIQATVALRDNLFPNMTYEDWIISTKSKVTGTRNLDILLPQGLDFFIILSSLNGIFGGRAQANYAAGNTFKDSIARARVQRGEKAIAIDLGLMVSEGVVAENPHLLAAMRRIGHLMEIEQQELLALLDHYCDPGLPLLSADDSQVLVGIEMPKDVAAKGISLHHSIHRPMFRHLFHVRTAAMQENGDEGPAAGQQAPAVLLARASSEEDAAALTTMWLTAKLGHVLGLDPADIDTQKPVHAYGVDSLVAIDLKNWLAREIGSRIDVLTLMGSISIEQVGVEAARKSEYRRGRTQGA